MNTKKKSALAAATAKAQEQKCSADSGNQYSTTFQKSQAGKEARG